MKIKDEKGEKIVWTDINIQVPNQHFGYLSWRVHDRINTVSFIRIVISY